MKLFLNGILLVLLAMLLLPQTEAGMASGYFADPAHPGKCVIKPNLILNPGQIGKYPDMDCARIICGENSLGQIHTCGAVGAPPNCEVEPMFPNADYPKCCEVKMNCN
ncbi:uncharacterized protein LOC117563299 [Drosophila albomicans]|uniref:Uncharacterized protein LOC117563299 n=1 Tax=Drosophila albomicans TaxID=7291 RepID=A0A6P8W1D8_DROAB|nr:uncharacterized protein LOC117563299 [Drosophila albomicans]